MSQWQHTAGALVRKAPEALLVRTKGTIIIELQDGSIMLGFPSWTHGGSITLARLDSTYSVTSEVHSQFALWWEDRLFLAEGPNATFYMAGTAGAGSHTVVGRFDSSGTSLWVKSFGGPLDDYCEYACVAANGDILYLERRPARKPLVLGLVSSCHG